MAIIPTSIPAPSTNAIASYDSTDLAEGTGIVKYYGFATKTSGAALSYHLTTQALRSSYGNLTNDITEESKSSADDGTTDGFSNVSSWNFDLSEYNLPQTIKGTVIINHSIMALETDASRAYGYFKFKVINYDGTTENLLALGDSELVDAGDSTYQEKKTCCIPIEVPRTHFKRGDILRVKVMAYMQHVSGGNTTRLHMPHSPQNTNTTNFTASSYPTKFEAYVPYEIDL